MSKLLIETVLEGGGMSREDIERALAGRAAKLDTNLIQPHSSELKAVVAWIEYAIGRARQDSEEEAISAVKRDEACGAARHLRTLREELLLFMLGGQREKQTD